MYHLRVNFSKNAILKHKKICISKLQGGVLLKTHNLKVQTTILTVKFQFYQALNCIFENCIFESYFLKSQTQTVS
jgi:hypothetical protein